MSYIIENWVSKKIAGKINRTIEKMAQKSPSTNIFVACFPKSGSTYLTTLLSEITGFELRSASYMGGHNEQDIYERRLQYMCLGNSVTQQHTKGTENNVRLMKKYNIKPVILVRNIFDVVLSIHDHIEKEDHRGPAGYVHREYFSMSKEEKLIYIIRIMLPWYLNFFVSWREASQEIDTFWTSYEELFSKQVSTVSQILGFYEIYVGHNQIPSAMSAIEGKNTRLNIGISGRGDSLPEIHKKAILDLASVWKIDGADMKIIGIEL